MMDAEKKEMTAGASDMKSSKEKKIVLGNIVITQESIVFMLRILYQVNSDLC